MAIVCGFLFSIAFALPNPHPQLSGTADPDFLKTANLDSLRTSDLESSLSLKSDNLIDFNLGLVSPSQSDITENPFQPVGNPPVSAIKDRQKTSPNIVGNLEAKSLFSSLNSERFLRSDSSSNGPGSTTIIDDSDSLNNDNPSIGSLISAASFTEIHCGALGGQINGNLAPSSVSESVALAKEIPKACPPDSGNPIPDASNPGGSTPQQRKQRINNQRKEENEKFDENFDCSKMESAGNQGNQMGRNPKYRFCCTQGPAPHTKKNTPGVRQSRYIPKKTQPPLEAKSTIRRQCVVCTLDDFLCRHPEIYSSDGVTTNYYLLIRICS